jgi:hypothetical protein
MTTAGQLVRLESDGTVWQQSGSGWVQIGHDGFTTGGVGRDIWMLGMTPVPGTKDDQVYRLTGGQLKLLPGAFNRFLASGVSAVWAADSHNHVYVGYGSGWSQVSSVVDYDGSIWFMGQDNSNYWSAKSLYHYTGQRLAASNVVSGNYSQVLADEYSGKNGGAADNWIWLLTPNHQLYYRQQNGTFKQAPQAQTSDGSIWALGPVILPGYPGEGPRYVVRYDGTQLTDMFNDAAQISVQSNTVYITANGTTEKWNGSDWVAVNTSGGSGSLDSWEAALTQAQSASAKSIPSLDLRTPIDLSQSTVANDLVGFLIQFAQGNQKDAGVNNLSIDVGAGEVSGSFWIRCHQSWGSFFGQELNAYDFTVSGTINYNFYTQDVSGDIELSHGININLQDLYDATRGDFTGLIADCTGVSRTNNYAQVGQPSANRYFASQSFVDWAGPETIATWAVEAVASGGSSLSAVPGEIAAHLTTEAQGIAAWLQARLGDAADQVADQIVNALVSRQNLQTPLFQIQWQPVDYYYASDLLPSLKTPPISHLGFAITLVV